MKRQYIFPFLMNLFKINLSPLKSTAEYLMFISYVSYKHAIGLSLYLTATGQLISAFLKD